MRFVRKFSMLSQRGSGRPILTDLFFLDWFSGRDEIILHNLTNKSEPGIKNLLATQAIKRL